MAFTKVTADPANISKLSNRPNQNDGLSAAQLKGRFDKAGVDLTAYLNDVLTEELESTTDGDSGADNIGATAVGNGTATTVQGILEEIDADVTALDGAAVHLTGDETIDDVKTFSSSPIVPAPTTDTQASTKKYVDDADALKVNITDIVNDLTTGGTAVPLSAEQGKVLKENSDTHIADTLKHKQAASIVQSGILANAEGDSTIASGDFSHAEGYDTKASGNNAHSEGDGTEASGFCSHAEGSLTLASGSCAHAEGSSTIASGNFSHAEGYKTEATGTFSHAEGNETKATGDFAHAEGNMTVASEAMSHAEGCDTEASGYMSHAEGSGTKASNYSSHAEGADTVASGPMSHAEGQGTKAIGQASHAEGAGAEAKGAYSHAGGEGTIAKGYAQTAIGVFNVEQGTEGAKAATDHALIIGNGTDEARANALAVKWNGDTDIAGDMNIPSGKKYKINGTALAASDVGAVATTDIVNDLTETGTGKVLDARQGKTLSDKIGNQTYTEGNYIENGEPLATSIDKLDMQLKDTAGAVNTTMYNTPWDAVLSNPDKEVLLCIGDSLTEWDIGYIAFLQNVLRKSTGNSNLIVNRFAFSGYRIWDIYNILSNYLGEAGQNLYPDANVITILLGTNDTKTVENNEFCSIGLAKMAYILMIDWLLKHRPGCSVRIMRIPWIREDTTDGAFLPTATWEENRTAIEKVILGVARRYAMPIPPDLYEATKGQDQLYMPDGLHFNNSGYRWIAPYFRNLLKQVVSYSADREFLSDKEYTISGGVIKASYAEWDPIATYNRKLTNGKFCILENNDISLNDMLGFDQADNGGNGATVNVKVEFDFGEEVVINDVASIHGNTISRGYSPNKISYYSWDGTAYYLIGEINAREEFKQTDLLFERAIFMPEKPFKARGLKIVFTKTYGLGPVTDWLFIGEIAATKLDNYKGEIMDYSEMELET